MANPINPNDPYRVNPPDEQFRRAERMDNELQPDPELDEGSVGGGRIAVYAVAIALILGAVLYGLSNSNSHRADTTVAPRTAETQSGTPTTPPGMRDVTPHPNSSPGTTTGASTNRPAPSQPPDTNPAAPPPPADNSVAPPAGTNTPR